jgi:hypothetical protein
VTAISFPLPLKELPAGDANNSATRYIGPEEGEGEANESQFIKSHECGGTAASPSAAEGHLCLFATEAEDLEEGGIQTLDAGQSEPSVGIIGVDGAAIRAISKEAGVVSVRGSWAMTAE